MSLKKTLIFIYLAEESRRIKPGKASVLSIFFTDKRNVEGKEGKHLEKENIFFCRGEEINWTRKMEQFGDRKALKKTRFILYLVIPTYCHFQYSRHCQTFLLRCDDS